MIILGIETSCDETACGIVESAGQRRPMRLLSNAVLSSMDLHVAYGGVVPEIAARSHIESILPVIESSLKQAFDSEKSKVKKSKSVSDIRLSTLRRSTKFDPWDQIDGIAVTYGAGLGGSLLVGVMTARTLAITKNKPLYAINHVDAHIYANFLTEMSPICNGQFAMDNGLAMSNEQLKLHGKLPIVNVSQIANSQLLINYKLPKEQPEFPMLGLIVSGGHSQLVLWRDHFDYTLLGQTQDDAIGEAFDKVAKLLGLPYPGGPSIGKAAQKGDPYAFNFPKAKMPNKYDYSFSGPKTAVLRAAQELIGENHAFPSHKLAERLSEAQKANIAASFQRIAVETVVDKTLQAFEEFQPKSVVMGGGVAASPELRRQLAERLPIKINYTDPRLCTDNGAMVATLGCYKAMLNQPPADPYTLDIAPNLSM